MSTTASSALPNVTGIGTDNSNSTSLDPSDPQASCETGSSYNGSLGLRVGAIFVILATSTFGALFPILARRMPSLRVPGVAFDFAKYFGSGVIIATAFIHLLSPAFQELQSPCLLGTWQLYPWPAAIAMFAIIVLFIVEFLALRIGMAKLEALGVEIDGHLAEGHPEHQRHHDTTEGASASAAEHARAEEEIREELETGVLKETTTTFLDSKGQVRRDADTAEAISAVQNPAGQILGVAILEFGVIFHSITIGLTLAVTDDFTTLFIVIIFHQMFEGLGLGSRLAYLPLPKRLNYVPILGAVAYAFVTPLGLAIGLGVRTTYNDNSVTANIVQGVLDSISAGILLYTGLVELLAHEFLFNPRMRKAPIRRILFSLTCLILGCGIMALLGRWA